MNNHEENKNKKILLVNDKFSQQPINNYNNINNNNPSNISQNEKTTIRSDIFKIFQGLFYIAADTIRSEKLEAELFVLTFNSKIFSYFYQLMPLVDFAALKIRNIDRFSNLLNFFQEQKKPLLILAGWVQFTEEIDQKRSLHTLNYFANNELFGSDSIGINQDIFYFHYNKVNQLRKLQYFENSTVPFMFLDILKVNFANCLIFLICRYESKNNLEDDHIENRVRPPYRIKKKFVQKILLPIEKFNFEKKNNLNHYTVFPLPEKPNNQKAIPTNNEKNAEKNQISPISQQKMENPKQDSSIDSTKTNNINENLERILEDVKSICLKKILFLEDDVYRTRNMDLIAKDLQAKKQEIQKVCKYLSISLLDQIKTLTQNANKSPNFDKNPPKTLEKEEGEVETEAKESKEYFLYTKNDQENHLLIEELNTKTLNVLRMSLPKLISIEFKLKKKSMEYIECHKEIFEEFMIFLKEAHSLVNLKFNFSKSATGNEWGCSIADLLYDLTNIKSLTLDFSTTNFNDYTFFLIVQSLKKMNNLFFLEFSCNKVNLTDDSAENLKKSLDSEEFWNKLKEGAISLRDVKISQENLERLHSIFKEKFKRIKFFS